MKIAITKEISKNEARVAIVPEVVKQLLKLKVEVEVEQGAGLSAGFTDQDYKDAGASVVKGKDSLKKCDVLIKINPPSEEELKLLPSKSLVVSFLHLSDHKNLIPLFEKNQINQVAMEWVPRISRAQSMDALSSQANLGGYKAVILGAHYMRKIFPLLMTAAGTITPAKVLIFGAGVAGLQAVATAKRLGAVVEVTDVRPETKEQVESLGGRFLEVEGADQVETTGGYAKTVSEDFLKKQKALISEKIKDADLVITTAQVLGRKAPVLVSKEMVQSMKPGAVIVDMAVEQGGNCELSKLDEVQYINEVCLVGTSNLPSHLAKNASELYSRNILALLKNMWSEQGPDLTKDDEIVKGSLVFHNGKLVHETLQGILKG